MKNTPSPASSSKQDLQVQIEEPFIRELLSQLTDILALNSGLLEEIKNNAVEIKDDLRQQSDQLQRAEDRFKQAMDQLEQMKTQLEVYASTVSTQRQ